MRRSILTSIMMAIQLIIRFNKIYRLKKTRLIDLQGLGSPAASTGYASSAATVVRTPAARCGDMAEPDAYTLELLVKNFSRRPEDTLTPDEVQVSKGLYFGRAVNHHFPHAVTYFTSKLNASGGVEQMGGNWES